MADPSLFDNAAMDGYAVRREDAVAGAVLRVVADLPAGSAEDPVLRPGEAARIMTGAPVPSCADAIVPLEHTDLGTLLHPTAPERVTVLTAPGPGAHIRRIGEDRGAGAVVVPAGVQLGPWQLSAIAASGHERVHVGTSARVAIVSTGSELLPPQATPGRGRIPESNSALLRAAVDDAGGTVVLVLTVPDDPGALRAALHRAQGHADAVVLTGGASVGAFDTVRAVLGAEHGVRFDRVAMQPGKPQGFGAEGGTLFFCLPGNPVSVAVSFEMFVRPALRALSGFAEVDRRRLTMVAGSSWRCPPGRVQVMPVTVGDGLVRPAVAGGSRSHLVSSLASAEAFAVIPAETDEVSEGDAVSVMVLS